MTPRAENENNRIHLRYPVKLLVEIATTGNQSVFVAETQDLSQGGISFYCGWRLPVGQPLTVTFIFAQKSFEMKARVTYCNEEVKTWRFFVGAAFLDASGTCYVNLAKQFVRMIEEDQQNPSPRKVVLYETNQDAKVDKAPKTWWQKWFRQNS